MIQTYSTTIRRKEMDAVLTCMVDEKIGPGELNVRFIHSLKEFFNCDGAVALRTPKDALKYALNAIDFPSGEKIMISALAPAWHYQAVESLGYVPMVLDVDESNGLVNEEIVQRAINHGGRLLLLHESMGIVPDVQSLCALGIPIIEDVSKSAGSSVSINDTNGNLVEKKKVGSFGVYSILTLEEQDVITAGGGAVLMAPGRREWTVLKKYVDVMPRTELLPDINCALGWVQVKEFRNNEITRKRIFSLYQRACMAGKHKIYSRNLTAPAIENQSSITVQPSQIVEEFDDSSTIACFPLVLSSSFKDVRQYAEKKGIEIKRAYEDSVIAIKEDELSDSCIRAKSLYLRCVLFPLYPRLSNQQVAKIVKVLGTLP